LTLWLKNPEKLIYCFDFAHIIINNMYCSLNKNYDINDMKLGYMFYCNIGVEGTKAPWLILQPFFHPTPLKHPEIAT